MKRVKIAAVLYIMVFSWLISGAAFADGGATPGTNPSGGGCQGYSSIDYWDTCFGLSWQKYKVIKDLPDSGVYFYYTSNTNSSGAVDIAGCKKGQYVYNYGFEVFNGNTSIGYQVSTQQNKNLTQAPHAAHARGAYSGSTTGGYLEVIDYASMDEANSSFNKMKQYLVRHPDTPFVGNKDITFSQVGAFCFSDEADNDFEGKTEVSGAANQVVGYTNESETKIATINNCSVTDGCKINFKHSLRRTNGDGSTGYTVSRTSNFIETGSSSRAIPNNSKLKTGTFDGEEVAVSNSGELTLYPGMVVCEKLVFSPNSYTSDQVNTRVCVRALGSVDTSLNMKVKNNSVEKYNNYAEVVYAKPGDEVTYKAEYRSLAQYTRRIRPEQMRIDDGGYIENKVPCNKVVASSDLIWYCQLEVLYNGKKGGDLRNWNNGFTVFGETFSYSADFAFDVGDESNKVETNDRSILDSDVGKELSEKAETNKNDKTKTTIKKVEFVAGSGSEQTDDVNVAAELNTGIVESDVVRAYVPYNFNNEVRLTNEDDLVYAGEKKEINYDLTVKKRYNEETNGDYATYVPGAKWGVKIKYGDNEYGDDVLSDGGDLSVNGKEASGVIDVEDVPAGTRFCVLAWLTPADSGDFTNVDVNKFSGMATAEKCYRIAKKPNFQVWGGSIYSAGNLNLENALATKTTLANYGNGTYVFGPWTELSLIVKGKANGIASGAGLGCAENNNGTLWPEINPSNGQGNNGNVNGRDPGGNTGVNSKADYCKISTLSFANKQCNDVNGSVGFNIISNGTAGTSRESLISRFNDENNKEYALISCDDNCQIGDEYQSFSYLEEDGMNKSTVIIKSNSNITLNKDITYNNGNYENLDTIPKIIIFAKNNIEIACNVTRIDAVLIAGDKVNTCNSGNINAKENSTPLRINGSIIANTLDLNRTYGAATGANSMVPAEIVNYDASLYLWASGKSDVIRTGKMVNTYQRELSPRY